MRKCLASRSYKLLLFEVSFFLLASFFFPETFRHVNGLSTQSSKTGSTASLEKGVPEDYAWLEDEDEGADMLDDNQKTHDINPKTHDAFDVLRETQPLIKNADISADQAAEREHQVVASVREQLAAVLSEPWSSGVNNAGGKWDEFCAKDQLSQLLLQKQKPHCSKHINDVAEYIQKSLSRCRVQSVFPNVFDEEDSTSDNPSNYLAAGDIAQMFFALMSKNLVHPHLVKAEAPSLELLCGTVGGGRKDKTYVSRSSRTIALLDSMSTENEIFANSFMDSLVNAVDFWMQGKWVGSFGSNSGQGTVKSRAEQVIREALVRADTAYKGEGASDIKLSVTLADFVEPYLHLVSKGTTSANVFRRSDRSRFQYVPVFSTLMDDSLDDSKHFLTPSSLTEPTTQSSQSSDVSSVKLEQDDIVVFLSDGVTDNMYMHEINSIIYRVVTPSESRILAEAEMELNSQGVEWDLPAFGSSDSTPIQHFLRFTTPPQKVADALTLAGRYHISEDQVAGPWAFKSLLSTGGTVKLGSRPDDLTAIVCYATSPEHKTALSNLWNYDESDFIGGSPSLVRSIKRNS